MLGQDFPELKVMSSNRFFCLINRHKPKDSSFTVMNDKGNKSTHLKSSKCLTNLLKKIIK